MRRKAVVHRKSSLAAEFGSKGAQLCVLSSCNRGWLCFSRSCLDCRFNMCVSWTALTSAYHQHFLFCFHVQALSICGKQVPLLWFTKSARPLVLFRPQFRPPASLQHLSLQAKLWLMQIACRLQKKLLPC